MAGDEKPAPATDDADGKPPKVKMQPLGMDFARKVAEGWHHTAQARAIILQLPTGIKEMLEEQPDDFVLGFLNGIQCAHDIGLKALLDDVRRRLITLQQARGVVTPGSQINGEQLQYPTDRLIITVSSVVEGVGWMAANVMTDREDAEKEESSDE